MIRIIKWNNSEVLGDLKLDFTKNAEGKIPYKTIVLAGDNGTGKTTILSDLACFLDGGSIKPFSYISYETKGKNIRIEPLDNDPSNLRFGVHLRVYEDSGATSKIFPTKHDPSGPYNSDAEDIRLSGFAFSRARAGFQTSAIKAITTERVDDDKFNNDSDNQHDFTKLKQLLVDVNAEDDEDIGKEFRDKGSFGDLSRITSNLRMPKFINAFESFFKGEIKFDGVKTEKDCKQVYFKKNGKQVSIDDFSTGEKQIVFRGTQLLRNSKIIKNGIVLIDEPELSMHPKWQERILKYYQDLFKDAGTQSVQLLVATHSEYVIKSALKDPDALVIVLKNNNGVVNAERIEKPFILDQITNAEVIYNAFGVYTNDYHNQLYCFLQDKVSKPKVKDCDDYIKGSADYDPSKHCKPSSFGSTSYETLPTFIRNAIDHYDNGNAFNDEELETSTKLLLKLCEPFRPL